MDNFVLVDCLKGTLQYFNEFRLIFKLKEKHGLRYHIHIGLFAHYNHIIMPEIGEEILIKSLLRARNTNDYYLNNKSIMYRAKPDGVFMPEYPLTKLIREYNLTIIDLYNLNTYYPSINVKVFDVTIVSFEMKLILFRHFMKVYKGKSLQFPIIRTVDYLRKLNPDERKYPNLDYYKQYIYYNEIHEYLIGCLNVDVSGSMVLIENAEIRLNCQILTDDNDKLWNLLKKLVIIRKFTYIIETYEGNQNRCYVMFDLDDMMVLDTPLNCVELNFPIKHVPPEYVHKLDMFIVSIAMPNILETQRTECWLLVQINNSSTRQWEELCLCLEAPYKRYLPLLECNHFYQLHTKAQLIPYKNPEVNSSRPSLKSFKLLAGIGIIMKSNSKSFNKPVEKAILKVDEFFLEPSYIARTNIINFQAKIQMKHFQNSTFQSRLRKYPNSAFGSPGSKQHVIRFFHPKRNLKCNLYINNWEHRIYPMGLVPNSCIRVYHAIYQKQNYYIKCDSFTHIKIVKYNQNVQYTSADNMGQYFESNLSAAIPFNIHVRYNAFFLHATTLRLMYNKHTDQLSCIVVFIAKSTSGLAFINTKSWTFVTNVLFDGESDKGYKMFLKYFKMIEFYSIYAVDTPKTLDVLQMYFYNLLHQYIETRVTNITFIEFVCKHMEPKSVEKVGDKLDRRTWDGLEFFYSEPKRPVSLLRYNAK